MDRLDVVKEKWDYLVILDACRYDYFQRSYEKYLNGDLSKKISIGSCTNQWRDESFPDRYDDIVYISANPQFAASSSVYGYTAGEHFHKVHQLWKDDWNADLGTVLPEVVTERAIEIISNTDEEKRFIIHYLQPHAPYVGLGSAPKGYLDGDVNAQRELIGADKEKSSELKGRVYNKLMKFFSKNKILTNRPEWILRKLLGIAPIAPMEIALRTLGKKKLRQAYKANLEIALEQVAELIKPLSGRIVITADHGELLGEDRSYSHPTEWTHPILVEVPWLVIEKSADADSGLCQKKQQPAPVDNEHPSDQQDEDEAIIERLRALGYHD